MSDCPHCPDGHTPATQGTWSAYVSLTQNREGDSQPPYVIVSRPNGAHVAESDADWIRGELNDHLFKELYERALTKRYLAGQVKGMKEILRRLNHASSVANNPGTTVPVKNVIHWIEKAITDLEVD